MAKLLRMLSRAASFLALLLFVFLSNLLAKSLDGEQKSPLTTAPNSWFGRLFFPAIASADTPYSESSYSGYSQSTYSGGGGVGGGGAECGGCESSGMEGVGGECSC